MWWHAGPAFSRVPFPGMLPGRTLPPWEAHALSLESWHRECMIHLKDWRHLEARTMSLCVRERSRSSANLDPMLPTSPRASDSSSLPFNSSGWKAWYVWNHCVLRQGEATGSSVCPCNTDGLQFFLQICIKCAHSREQLWVSTMSEATCQAWGNWWSMKTARVDSTWM